MRIKKRPEIDEDSLPVNPFVSFLDIPVNKVIRGLGQDGKVREMELEKSKYAKVYITPAIRKYTSNLSGSAALMFIWILQELDSGRDWLWVNKERYQKEHDIKSMKTVNAALVELDNKRFIDGIAGKKDVYFINPVIFFCGSRINKYPECVSR